MKYLKSWAWPLLLVTLIGGVYLATLLPGVGGWGDTGKFQFLGRILGTPHTTGYPLYLVLNHLFTKLFPFGTLAYKANLLSAIFALLSSLYLYRTLLLLTCERAISAVITMAFAFTLTFWQYAIIAEVYTLNALFVSMVLYYLLQWRQHRNNTDLLLACALYALSFGNHLTMILLLPGIIFFLVATDAKRAFTKKNIALVTFFIALGAAQYLYLYWRYLDTSTPFLEMQVADWSSFFWYITGAQFKSQFFPFSWSELITQEIPFAAQEIFRQWYFYLGFAAIGIWSMRDRVVMSFLVIIMVCYGSFVINYGIFDIYPYYLPIIFILTIFIGQGVSTLQKRYFREIPMVYAGIIALIPLTLLVGNDARVNQSEKSTAKDTEQILEEVGSNAILLPANYSQASHFWYYLLGLDWGEQRNLSIAFQDPMVPLFDEVVDYLSDDEGFVLPFERREVEPGLAVYVLGQYLHDQLEQEGLKLIEVDPSHQLYRVQKSEL